MEITQKHQLFYQEKQKEEVNTRDNRPSNCILSYVCDYLQNLYIPTCASEQPGETYYYSFFNCYCFGIIACSTLLTRLTALVYNKDIGKKGCNNVALLLWMNLKRLGVQDTCEPFKEITFVMDNCGGQRWC